MARPALRRAAFVAGAVLVADQATKALVRARIARGEEVELVPGVVQLVNVRNTGVAFGAFAGGGAIVTVVVLVALGVMVAYFATHADHRLAWLPTGLLLGGALGNLVDRVREGAVTDFVDLPSWPAFNVADASISVGVVVLLLLVARGDGARGRA